LVSQDSVWRHFTEQEFNEERGGCTKVESTDSPALARLKTPADKLDHRLKTWAMAHADLAS
jgi:hypothetical protein